MLFYFYVKILYDTVNYIYKDCMMYEMLTVLGLSGILIVLAYELAQSFGERRSIL